MISTFLFHSLTIRFSFGLLVVLASCLPVFAFPEELIDSPMYRDPLVHDLEVVNEFVDARNLWRQALARPESEWKSKAAEAIALAHRKGVKKLDELIPDLLKVLEQQDQHPSVRLAVARTLIILDAKSTAPNLFKLSQSGTLEFRELVEPVFVQWDHQPIHAVWLARLREEHLPQRELILAIRGVASTKQKQASDALRTIVLSDRGHNTVRIEAARSLGILRTEGLESDAKQLASDTTTRGMIERLLATLILKYHPKESAIRILQDLVRDKEPVVATSAAEGLLGLDSKHLLPLINPLLAHPDPNMRSIGVEVIRKEPTLDRITLLANRLEDVHQGVRSKTRKSLEELAGKKEWQERVIREGTKHLGRNPWQSQEQSIILLTHLNYKPAVDRMVELLKSTQSEVFVTAAWGLRKLAVPETLPKVLKYVNERVPSQLKLQQADQVKYGYYDHQLSQLFQFFGYQKYMPADPILRRMIPRIPNPTGSASLESRAAAIWALGMIHAEKADKELIQAVEGRLTDVGTLPPEDPRVRTIAAVILGKMKATDAESSLRKFYIAKQPALDSVNNACGWAIEQITGEIYPKVPPIKKILRDGVFAPVE
jgi:HEAT repeat protein